MTPLQALETQHKIIDQLMTELILLHHDERGGYWFPTRQPWWPDFEEAFKTMKRMKESGT